MNESTEEATEPVKESSVLVRAEEGGRILRLVLNRPPGNILDVEMIERLREELTRACDQTSLRAVCFDTSGANFSYGVSIQDHEPASIRTMLESVHGLFRDLVGLSLPLVASVRGHCLGGGLELAAICHRVFASKDGRLGQPEIRLGAIAPVASLVLPERMGRAAAEDLLLGGHSISAEEALGLGLVDEMVEDPTASALAYARARFLDKSAVAIRSAVRAQRIGFHRDFLARLDEVERLYLDEVMPTADAQEGVRAFFEKRAPKWEDD